MSAPEQFLTGDQLVVAVADAMIAFHHTYHQSQPVTGKAMLLSADLLACVLAGAASEVEKTMLELHETTVLQEIRSPFQDDMQGEFLATVRRLSGRHVHAFMSNHRTDPETEIEIFLLGPPPRLRIGRHPSSAGTVGYAYAWERPPAD